MDIRRSLTRRIHADKTWLHYALKCYALVHPPPFRRPNMEFEGDAWNSISALHYRGGRMLGEDNSGPYPFREITGNRYDTCPFQDSRLGLPMNITNLELVLPYAADAYRLTTRLRNLYIAERGLTDVRFNLSQAYLFSKLSVGLPAFLVRRRDDPVRDGDIDPLETAFYMLGAAPFILIRQLISRGERPILDTDPKTGDELYALSDQSRTLISNRECACPANPTLIAGYFDVIMNGSYRGSLESAAVDRVFSRVGSWKRLYQYTLAASRIDLLVLLNKAMCLRLLYGLTDEAARISSDVIGRLEAGLLGPLTLSHIGAPTGQRLRQTVDNAIESFTALLRDHGDTETPDSLSATLTPSNCTSDNWGARETVHMIRSASSVILKACRRDLQMVHTTLGTTRWPAIGIDDIFNRSGGPEFASHLQRLSQLPVGTPDPLVIDPA